MLLIINPTVTPLKPSGSDQP